MLDGALAEEVQEQLRPGERLLWSGRGDPSVIFSPMDALMVPFTIFFMGFVLVWGAGITSTIPLTSLEIVPFAVIGAIFFITGLYSLIGRFFVKAYRKRTTAYAVTDRRAFWVNGRTTREVSLSADRLTTWSRDRSHVTVSWNTINYQTTIVLQPRWGAPANSGLDGIRGPLPMGFFDVSDGAALIAALDSASARTTAQAITPPQE